MTIADEQRSHLHDAERIPRAAAPDGAREALELCIDVLKACKSTYKCDGRPLIDEAINRGEAALALPAVVGMEGPKEGDMIARNPKNHDDKWLVAAQYFADNFEPI